MPACRDIAAVWTSNSVTVSIGDIYEREFRDGHYWKLERRLVLDVADQCVLYQILYDEPEGTYVEHDITKDQKQTSMKKWLTWMTLARKVEK